MITFPVVIGIGCCRERLIGELFYWFMLSRGASEHHTHTANMQSALPFENYTHQWKILEKHKQVLFCPSQMRYTIGFENYTCTLGGKIYLKSLYKGPWFTEIDNFWYYISKAHSCGQVKK